MDFPQTKWEEIFFRFSLLWIVKIYDNKIIKRDFLNFHKNNREESESRLSKEKKREMKIHKHYFVFRQCLPNWDLFFSPSIFLFCCHLPQFYQNKIEKLKMGFFFLYFYFSTISRTTCEFWARGGKLGFYLKD